MSNTAKILVLTACIGTSGCAPDADMPMHTQTRSATGVKIDNDTRITVTRIGVFSDDLAYNNRRGVYIIVDRESGKTFVGVSGIGISEIGGHYVSTGKSGYNKQDER